jgi:hypothetical protein
LQLGASPDLALSGGHPKFPPDLRAHSCPVISLGVAEITRWLASSMKVSDGRTYRMVDGTIQCPKLYGVSKRFLQQLSRFTFQGGSSSLVRFPSLHRYHEQKKSNPYLLFGDLGIARPRIVFVCAEAGAATRAVRVARFLIPIGIVFSRATSSFF